MVIRARGCLNSLIIAAFIVLVLTTAFVAWTINSDLLLPFAVAAPPLTIAALLWIAFTPRQITIDDSQVQIVQLLRHRTLAASDVSTVSTHWYGLRFTASHGTLVVPSLDAAFNAHVAITARTLLPQPAAAHRRWLAAGLPLVIAERRGNLVLTIVAAAALAAIAVILGAEARSGEESDGVVATVFLFAAGALWLIVQLLFWYPLATEFDARGMTVRCALRRIVTPLPELRAVELSHETRSLRRIPHTIAVIHFVLADGRRVRWVPFESAWPRDYVEAEMHPQAEAIATRLRTAIPH